MINLFQHQQLVYDAVYLLLYPRGSCVATLNAVGLPASIMVWSKWRTLLRSLAEPRIVQHRGSQFLSNECRTLFRLLTRLLDDPQLPLHLRPLISSAIAYFILPADIISEELHGPYGYVDDIWLCAYVADVVRRQLGDEAILAENWEGEAPLLPLIREILDKEPDLIGDERDKILWYTGCAELIE